MEKEYLSVNEVAELLGFKTQSVYAMVKRGEIPAYKIGGKSIKIKKSELEAYIRTTKVDPETHQE